MAIAIDSHGMFPKDALTLLSELGPCLSVATGAPRETSFRNCLFALKRSITWTFLMLRDGT